MQRKVKFINKTGISSPGGLLTSQAIPTADARSLNPFIMLNHHGPQDFQANNKGLPFGPHPHRGFETLTFVERGSLRHRDSLGGDSTIYEGGVQWMTAGSGIVHAEESSTEFKNEGGEVELLQLWMNLPADLKMSKPAYFGLEASELPKVPIDSGKAELDLISGFLDGVQGPVRSLTGLFTSRLRIEPGAEIELNTETSREVMLYVVSGKLNVNGKSVATYQMPVFEHSGNTIVLHNTGNTQATLLFCHGEPLNEPVASYGPFVLNTEEEIEQAINDYQSGRMGRLV